MQTIKKRKSYRFNETTIKCIKKLMEKYNISTETQLIEMIIKKEFDGF